MMRVPMRISLRPVVLIAISSIALLSAVPALAQYKYKDANGRTVYSDQPPPSNASAVTRQDFSSDSSSVDSSNMPYELRRAVQSAPVTLYTFTECDACEAARQFFNSRGVPYVEKTAAPTDADRAALTSLGLGTKFPSVSIGANKLTTFSSNSWGAALDSAGYPTQAAPAGSYRNPAPTPLVAPTPAASAPTPTATAPVARPTTPTTNPDNPAGIRF